MPFLFFNFPLPEQKRIGGRTQKETKENLRPYLSVVYPQFSRSSGVMSTITFGKTTQEMVEL